MLKGLNDWNAATFKVDRKKKITTFHFSVQLDKYIIKYLATLIQPS